MKNSHTLKPYLDLFLGFTTVTLSFVFDNYYPHMD